MGPGSFATGGESRASFLVTKKRTEEHFMHQIWAAEAGMQLFDWQGSSAQN
jgi:hypothetical protein